MPGPEDALVESAQAFIARPDGTIALRVVEAAAALLDSRAVATARASERACEAGCDFCCRMPVSLSMPEALRIHAHVTRTWSETEQASLAEALANASKGLEDEDALFLSQRPCVFLREGRCTIYPVRPLACRGHASFSRSACAEAHAAPDDFEVAERVPVDPDLRRCKDEIKTTLGIVLLQAGLHALDCELASLLARLVDEPDTPRAWLAGADLVAHLDCHALSSAHESLAELIDLAGRVDDDGDD